jgi:hypothetical protein
LALSNLPSFPVGQFTYATKLESTPNPPFNSYKYLFSALLHSTLQSYQTGREVYHKSRTLERLADV